MKREHLIGALIAFAILVAVYSAGVYFGFSDMGTRGQFGDMFGGLNALFSGLAFLGVIVAILLQREELGLQRKELELTRKELKRAAEAQEESGKALAKQAASLKVTAKLNALGGQLTYYSSLIAAMTADKYSREWRQIAPDLQQKAEAIMQEMERLTENK